MILVLVLICSHFGSITIQVKLPCNKLGMAKCGIQVETSTQYRELIPFKRWYDNNKKNPIFRHLIREAHRNWKALVYINNKKVKLQAHRHERKNAS